ncbi:YciI family protein [Aldersonia kunmingensis]|uniref:YciI family protein n=1 Tax=Aldersonia kunmingensis TaxID=408066 RepID=UPI0008333AEA|nr:YciI family protein [Aldersonia kunmingensis]
MQYLLLIYSNPDSWNALTDDQQRAVGEGHAQVYAELTSSGQLISGAGLDDHRLTTTVRVRRGEVSTTDGPFAEAKEHLAGFYLVECADHDEAVAIAARLPDAAIDFVLVRPALG